MNDKRDERFGQSDAILWQGRLAPVFVLTPAPQFTRIDDVEKLYHLMLQIQKETP